MVFEIKRKKEEGDVLKHLKDVVIGFERLIKTPERIYCSKWWDEEDRKGKLKAGLREMTEALYRYNAEVQNTRYEGTPIEARGKVEGMEEPVRILKDVME